MKLSLEGERLGYFDLVQRSLSPEAILTVDLVTTDNVIDRENPEILREGGLYQFQVHNIHWNNFPCSRMYSCHKGIWSSFEGAV